MTTSTATAQATDPHDDARRAAAVLAERTGVARHDVALVLGSGWAGAADLIGETVAEIPGTDLPGFSAPAVPGHVGTIRSIRLAPPPPGTADATPAARHALVLGARTHLYEGRGVRAVVHGVRTAAAAGVSTIVLTNGCGGLNPDWEPGTPVLISDHINLTATSPLEGATFVDLTDLYAAELREVARGVDPGLPEGVYVQLPGPHYETPAEVRHIRTIGGDLVGMSTALEAIAARAAGLRVLGLSLVTNAAAGTTAQPLSHDEVIEAGRAAGPRISALLAGVVAAL